MEDQFQCADSNGVLDFALFALVREISSIKVSFTFELRQPYYSKRQP